MTQPVSIVLPALDTRELLVANLPALLAECARRGVDDEVIVVDDTGTGALATWLGETFPDVRAVAREQNGGFARALHAGVEAARHPLVFSLNTDVFARPDFLDPLVEVLADDDVLAVSPRVLLNGDEDAVESRTFFDFEQGLLRLERSAGDVSAERSEPDGVHAVPFAVGGTLLFRRAEFLARGGFDPLYEPFYLEDVDWCWEGWTQGRRVVVQPASVVEHNHRGTIGSRVDPAVVRAAIERNRLLFLWKHLEGEELIEEHLLALARQASDAWNCEEREVLIWLLLALEARSAALSARAQRPAHEHSFSEVLETLRRERRVFGRRP